MGPIPVFCTCSSLLACSRIDLIASSDPVSEARIRVVMLPARRSHTNDIKPTPGTRTSAAQRCHSDQQISQELRLEMVRRQIWPPIYLYLLCMQLHSRYRDPMHEGLRAESIWRWMLLGQWDKLSYLLKRDTHVLGPGREDHLKATPITALTWGYVQGSIRVFEDGIPKGKMEKKGKRLRLTTY